MRTTALAMICLVLCAGCLQPRKAAERRAERRAVKAAAILAQAEIRAARLCPQCVLRDSVTLPADTTTLQVPYVQHLDVDSLLADCEQLREALSAERDLYLHVLASNPGTRAVPLQQLPPSAQRSVARLRERACQFEPISYESDAVRVEVVAGAEHPLLRVEEKARALPCPPHTGRPVDVDRIVHVGVARWWRTVALVLFGLMLCSIGLALWLMKRSHNDPYECL